MSAEPLSLTEYMTVARFDKAPPAPESFDATAALRRVLALAEELDSYVAASSPRFYKRSDYTKGICAGLEAAAQRIRSAVEGKQ